MLSSVTGASFMSISLLALEFWDFPFVRDSPKKSEILPSEFCPISGDWGELGIPDLANIFLIKCYWMIQIASVTVLTVFELLRVNQQEGSEVKLTPTQIRVRGRK